MWNSETEFYYQTVYVSNKHVEVLNYDVDLSSRTEDVDSFLDYS